MKKYILLTLLGLTVVITTFLSMLSTLELKQEVQDMAIIVLIIILPLIFFCALFRFATPAEQCSTSSFHKPPKTSKKFLTTWVIPSLFCFALGLVIFIAGMFADEKAVDKLAPLFYRGLGAGLCISSLLFLAAAMFNNALTRDSTTGKGKIG